VLPAAAGAPSVATGPTAQRRCEQQRGLGGEHAAREPARAAAHRGLHAASMSCCRVQVHDHEQDSTMIAPA
jgi:hypothetical protein